MTTDVILNLDSGYYDIGFTDGGDIKTSVSFDTPILMGIFAERRATASEVPESFFRRGWVGNESTPNFEMGSKLWQYYQARASFDALNAIQSTVREGQQWLVDQNLAVDVLVEATLKNGTITANLAFVRSSSRVDQSSFALWDNTNTGNSI